MYSDDNYGDVKSCEGCGKYFPKSQLRRCKKCGMVLCRTCQKRHFCFTGPFTHTVKSYTVPKKEHKVSYHTPRTSQRAHQSSSSKNRNIFSWLSLIFILILVVAVVLNMGSIADIFIPDPHIVPDTSVTGDKRTIISFDIGSGVVESVTVKADNQVYSGAKLPESRRVGSGNYWVMMTEDTAQDEFYDTLVNQFNDIKLRYDFTGDQYVEMVTSFVQTIDYDNFADDMPQYPVVTSIDKMGDCDEKSMLLAGILSHAGYDVALLHFINDEHMTAGIKTSDDYSYAGGYAVIETTVEGWYVSQTDLRSLVNVYPIGTGTKTYESASQVAEIVRYFNVLNQTWDSIESSVDMSFDEANYLYDRYKNIVNERDRINSQMADLNHQLSLEYISYDTYLMKWNSLENQYYSLTQQINGLWNQYESQYSSYSDTVDFRNDWAEIYDALAEAKVCDRAAMYRLITEHPLDF